MKPFLLLPVMILILSCTPAKPGTGSGQAAESQAVQDGESRNAPLSMTRTQDSEPESPAGDGAPQKEESQWDEFSGPLFLQRIRPHAYILADSLIVGLQADPLSPLLSEREADYLVRDFFKSYRAGRVKTELLTANVHPLLVEELEEYQKLGPEIRDFYLGSFRQTGSRSMVRVALLSDTGYIRGTIYMEEENGIWGIRDWEMPLGHWPGDPVPREGDDLIVPGAF